MIISHHKPVYDKLDKSVLRWNPISAWKRKSIQVIGAAVVNTTDWLQSTLPVV